MKKKTASKFVCSICKSPREVTYTEFDRATGQMVEKTHTVKCGGHFQIHPRLWNRSGTQVSTESEGFMRTLIYDDYRKFYNKLKKDKV